MDRRKLLITFIFGSAYGIIVGKIVNAQASFEAMEDDQFWRLIGLLGGSKWNDCETDFSRLENALQDMQASEIRSFFETLAQKLYAIDTRQHYRSFSWFPGLSDTFLYTRLAVVAQGQEYYRAVLSNPRIFPNRSTRWLETLLYVAPEAYEVVSGEELDRITSVDFESFSNEEGWRK